MLNTLSSFEVVLILFPGFLTLLVKNGLITIKEKKDIDKIIEALAYNLLNYGIYRFDIYLLNLIGIYTNITFNVIFILIIAVSNGVLIAIFLDKGWLYNFLREKLKVTNLTGKVAVWNDIFFDYRGKWLLIHLIDGRKIIGWPKYYSEDVKEKEIFLADAAWMKDNGDFIDVEGSGILITGNHVIELIEILDGGEKKYDKKESSNKKRKRRKTKDSQAKTEA